MKQASICSLFLGLITHISQCDNVDKKHAATPAPYKEYGNEYGGYDIRKWRKVMAGGVKQGKHKKRLLVLLWGKNLQRKLLVPYVVTLASTLVNSAH